jgi:methylenetetrahydrofolate dehydrogenase (NADP+)/methenyltetrahydrofolate cyclohydrolase
MTARVIDGRLIAERTRDVTRALVAALPYQPGLAVVLVGDDPASAVYVRSKDRAAAAVGIAVQTHRLPTETSERELLALLHRLNNAPDIDGILVQLPLPRHLRQEAVIDAIDPARDVDGLHPYNAGLLAAGRPRLVPCTPLGVMKLLAAAEVSLAGARALVLGRSVLVGRPMAALLTNANATVTLAHSRTRDVAAQSRKADVLIAAIGHPEIVGGDWVGPDAAVIDVGINRLPDGRLVGDVAYHQCIGHAGVITPVPGGVGPMTIACLLENTVNAAGWRRAIATAKIPSQATPG